ncbi:hypothetical protein LEP3755_53000 [Leptolyngbya sp. NIES-3755]|nr:hypothetical protein LEP3755_53000 [Leptolyngbya sp. NIES-3755]
MSALHYGDHDRFIREISEHLNRYTCLGLYSTDIFTAQFSTTLPGFYGDCVIFLR